MVLFVLQVRLRFESLRLFNLFHENLGVDEALMKILSVMDE